MTPPTPTLHMLYGNVAAGKSTLAKRLAAAPGTVLISEDHWTSHLFKEEMQTVDDYARYSRRLRAAMGDHLVALLKAGLSVVLDFPANTVANRQWMRGIFEAAGAAHCLHVLDVPDDVCRARLRQRNAEGTHAFAATDEEFDIITSYIVMPSEAEGFETIVYRLDETTGLPLPDGKRR
ncbi:MAG TPA: ATP-binding protein [Vineibacter sp.]|nr:ATP-binding protein [Vineibacter sp.]